MRNGHVELHLAEATRHAIWRQLLPENHTLEEAVFVYARAEGPAEALRLTCVEWEAVPRSGFSFRSAVYMELADSMKAAVIKRAHDLNASLIELHSHTGPWPAQFSASDLVGLREFVPHVFWRLKRLPYLAIVVTASGFDGLAWIDSPTSAVPLDALVTGRQVLRPTGLTLLYSHGMYERKQV